MVGLTHTRDGEWVLAIIAPGQGAQTPGFLAPWLEVPGVVARALGAAEERVRRGDPRGHEQRLADGGVADLVRISLRPVVNEVEIDDGGPPRQPVGNVRQIEPRMEEARCLGALAGSDEYEHSPTLSRHG